jgi:hypothetical protein
MKVSGPLKSKAENDRLRTLESDSRRWFEEQERREANGELGLLENPAFYTALFVFVPIAILVAGAASGVIPGFTNPTAGYEYSTLEQIKDSYTYGEITSAATREAGGSLF